MKIKSIIKRIKFELIYRRSVSAADSASRKSGGETFFVLPTHGGKLMVMSRKDFTSFKKAHLVDSGFKPRDLFRDCVYHTNCRSSKGKRSRKRKFLRWKGML